jgi:hypothetical protein
LKKTNGVKSGTFNGYMVYMRKLNTRKENINESAGILVAIKG